MRRATALLAVAAAAAALAITLVAAGLDAGGGSLPETRRDAVSQSGDVVPMTVVARRRAVCERTDAAATASDEEAPREASCAGPPPPERRLRIVDPDGAPLVDVAVGPGDRRTDKDGVVSFPVDGPDAAPVEASYFDGREVRRVALEKPETEVVVEHLPVLEVVVIDASTGRRVDPESVDVRLGGSGGSRDVRLEPERTLRLPLDESGAARVGVHVVPRAPFATVQGFAWSGLVARASRRVRIAVPVWPVADREFRITDTEGAAVDRAELWSVAVHSAHGSESFGSESIEWMPRVRAMSDASGRLVARGLPAMPVCAVTVRVARESDGESELPQIVGSVDGLRLDLPPAAELVEVRLSRPKGYRRGRPGEVPPDSREPSDPPPPPDIGSSELVTLTVEVARRDGSRAAGVEVSAGPSRATTDPDGRVRLSVPKGRVEVAAAAHGFVAAEATVDLECDTEIVLRESEPREARVCVVDSDGRRVPGARVTATSRGATVAQWEGDVELLTPRTGPDGCVRLEVPPGAVRYAVTLAGAYEEFESADDLVTVTLRSP
jgi:hypothetical protein